MNIYQSKNSGDDSDKVPVNKPQLGRILGIDLRWDSCSEVDCHESPDLLIGSKHYETAIYAPAPSVIEFNLGDGFDRLHTCFGVCCYGFGTANFRVTGDNQVLLDWQKKTGGEVASCIDIDLNGVTMLKLETNDAGDGAAYDFASWANSYVYSIHDVEHFGRGSGGLSYGESAHADPGDHERTLDWPANGYP